MKRKIALLDDPAFFFDSVNAREQSAHVTGIAESLARMGHQVDVFTCQENWEIQEGDTWREIGRIIHVPVGVTESRDTSAADLQEFANFMIEFCDRQERTYDLIHASFWSSGLVAAEIKATLGIPFVMTFQTPNGATRLSQESGAVLLAGSVEIQNRVVREADGIIAVSLQDRQDLISLYHADPMYIVQIPYGPYLTSMPGSQGSARQDGANMLAEFYEDVLAVRRVTLIQQDTALLPLSHSGHGMNQIELIDHAFESALQSLREARERLGFHIAFAANLMRECIKQGGRILVCGEDADMAHARQFSAEMGRAGLPVHGLISDSSFFMKGLNEIDNDGLSQQVEAVARPGDLLLGIGIHGNTEMLVQAFQSAHAKDIRCISLVGEAGGELQSLSDVMLAVPGVDAQRVHEVQLVVLHILFALVREAVTARTQIQAEPLFDSTEAITM